jgi:3-hydroxyisobutyrate dehydrogenase-like beta-hydroxyacid dehydrogenase
MPADATGAARARQLFIAAAGPAAGVERCWRLFDHLGQPFIVAEEPAQANLIKLLGNMMTATVIEVLAKSPPCCGSPVRIRSPSSIS